VKERINNIILIMTKDSIIVNYNIERLIPIARATRFVVIASPESTIRFVGLKLLLSSNVLLFFWID